jgi:hypothetical protein
MDINFKIFRGKVLNSNNLELTTPLKIIFIQQLEEA